MTQTLETDVQTPAVQPTEMDDFLFDLRGYLVLRSAISPRLLDELNATFDTFPDDLEMGDWFGNTQRRDYNKATGLELHNATELGAPFEELIDNPSWINYVSHYAGEEKSYVEGIYIDEAIASVRRSGGHHPVHSGGFQGALRGKYSLDNGLFRCGQVNILMALTDIGEGDGATMVVPGSHKSSLPYPPQPELSYYDLKPMDNLEAAIPVYLNKGDALLFVDGLMHGGSSRTTTEGERRVVIYRYGPVWGASRFGYSPSPELMERLTPARQKILQPVLPISPGEKFIPREN